MGLQRRLSSPQLLVALTGVALLTTGAAAGRCDEVSITMLILGAGLLALGLVFPRMQGGMKLGPGGFEASLAAAMSVVTAEAKVEVVENGGTPDEVAAVEHGANDLMTWLLTAASHTEVERTTSQQLADYFAYVATHQRPSQQG
jgi:hypothetical protein